MVDCSGGFYCWDFLNRVWNYTEPYEHDDAVDALRYAAWTVNYAKKYIQLCPDIFLNTRHLNINVHDLLPMAEEYMKRNHILAYITDVVMEVNGTIRFYFKRNAEPKPADTLRYATRISMNNNIKDVDRNYILRFNNYNTKEKEKTMKTIKDVDRIVITKNDLNEVLLRAYSGNEIVEKTIAKCSPDDIFDFNIGAKLAVDRLYEGYDMTPKQKRKPYNGKIFVRADVRNFGFFDFRDFTFKEPVKKYTRENKIWEVRDGKIICFDHATDIIYEGMTDEELTKLLCSTNNGIRGFYYNVVDGYFVR